MALYYTMSHVVGFKMHINFLFTEGFGPKMDVEV